MSRRSWISVGAVAAAVFAALTWQGIEHFAEVTEPPPVAASGRLSRGDGGSVSWIGERTIRGRLVRVSDGSGLMGAEIVGAPLADTGTDTDTDADSGVDADTDTDTDTAHRTDAVTGASDPAAAAGAPAPATGGAAITDEDGMFVWTGPAATRALAVRWGRFETSVPIEPGAEPIGALEIVCDTGFVLGGRVLGLDGGPLADALVEVSPSLDARSARTAADGTFMLRDIAAPTDVDTVSCRAQASGHAPASVVVACPPSNDRVPSPVTLRLEPAGAVEGFVTGPEGRPLQAAGARLVARVDGGHPRPASDELVAVTGPDGRYRIEGVPPGEYLMGFQHGDAPNAWVAGVVVEAARTREVDARLSLAGRVVGRVVAEGGAPVGGVRVLVERLVRWPSYGSSGTWVTSFDGVTIVSGGTERGRSRFERPVASTITGDDGTFAVDALGAGVVRVSALDGTPRALAPVDREVEVVAGDEVSITLTMPAGRSLAGVVVDGDDQPVAGAHLIATRVRDDVTVEVARAFTDEEGAFVLHGLPLDGGQVTATADGFLDAPAQPAPADGDLRVVLERTR